MHLDFWIPQETIKYPNTGPNAFLQMDKMECRISTSTVSLFWLIFKRLVVASGNQNKNLPKPNKNEATAKWNVEWVGGFKAKLLFTSLFIH